MPLDGVAVVRGKLVVEVVVSLAEGDESRDDVVARGVAVVEGLVAEPVGQGVDAEGGLLDEEDTQDAGVDEAALPVAPADAGDEAGEDHAHEDDGLEVVAVLPDYDGVIVQVRDVSAADALGVLLHDHPAEVGVEQALADGVRVLVSVGVSVVGAVVPRPPADGALDGAAAHGRQEDLERERCGVGGVSPQPVITWRCVSMSCREESQRRSEEHTSCDTHSGHEVVDDGPDSRLPLQRGPVGGDAAVEGDADDEDDIEPVDVLVPVLAGHG